MPTIRMTDVTKTYIWEKRKQVAALDVNLEIQQGEFAFVVGSGGAGKSTLLRLLSGEVKPDRGKVFLDDQEYPYFKTPRYYQVRRNFGHVWQEPMLIRKRTIGENLAVAIHREKLKRGEDPRQRVAKVLGLVGMAGVQDYYPVELSGGECRRVELARAMINSPPILVLDELTANLDEDNIWDIMYLLGELNRQGTTIVMATHASKFVTIMRKRVITVVEGRIFGDVQKGRYGDIV